MDNMCYQVPSLMQEFPIMMGYKKDVQNDLFYYGFNLEQRVRKNHPLRRIVEVVDFDFTYEEVKETYGINGNVSVPPPQILKMMLLLIVYNVRSERELMLTIPERLDWLWFLGYDLDDEIPNHSVLSKARARYKAHRSVDGQSEIITATEVTPGEVNEAHLLLPLLETHQKNTEKPANTVVADTKYGTVENYLDCHDLGIKAHIPDLKASQQGTGSRKGESFENLLKLSL